MGRRGPRPLPAEIHRARGTWRRDRHGDVEERVDPVAEPGARTPPPWLEASAHWLWWDLQARLRSMGVLALTDYYTLAIYCQVWVRWRKADDFVAGHGDSYLVKDRHGNVKGVRLYPQVKLANALAEQLARLGYQLGLSPASRSRASAIPSDVYEARERRTDKLPPDVRARVEDPTIPDAAEGI